jgi:all-trans-8'-apo-beta-carotenal 15,15'-oxygenase
MSCEADRRRFLQIAAASAGTMLLMQPERALAALAPADWRLGFRDVRSDIDPTAMQLVHGRRPPGLTGTLYRNGPARFTRAHGPTAHWFDGDGLVRRFTIDGRNAVLAARFVDTAKRRTEAAADAIIAPGFGTPSGPGIRVANADDINAANTNVMFADGEIWALWEAGSPMRLDPDTLRTKGVRTFGGDLAHMPFLAHPRFDPSGQVWNLGVSGKRAIVWRLDSRGGLLGTTLVELPRASYIHDFTATERHLVIVLQPWVFAGRGSSIVSALEWKPELGTTILVLDKADLTRRRLFELPPFAFFHLGDAWEESDGTIRFDACIERTPHFAVKTAAELPRGVYQGGPAPQLATISLGANGRGSLNALPIAAEFPKSDPRFAGRARRYSVHTGLFGDDRPMARGVATYDWQLDRSIAYDFGADHLVEEFVFAARESGELDGWLVGTTVNLKAAATELHVMDARNVAAGPVASWRAGTALPVGFHGVFAAA